MKNKMILGLFAVLVMMTAVTTVSATFCPDGSYWADGDARSWANSVSSTYGTVVDADEALGPDDNDWAVIKSTDGYIILDMGDGEEVWDRIGIDVRVYGDSSDETAYVYASNSPDAGSFAFAGSINSDETANVELPGGYGSSYRYIAIKNPNRNKWVEVDAVRGKCITDDNGNEVPEFGLIGGIAAVGLAGAALLVFRKK